MRELFRKSDTLWLAGFLAAIVALFVWAYRAEQKEREACEFAGGRWEVTGHHWQTTMLMVGKTMIPQVSRINEYGCIGGRE